MLDLAPNNFEVICAGGITFQNFQIIHSILNGKYYHGKKIIKI
jgi:copper homeostasis protein CutC